MPTPPTTSYPANVISPSHGGRDFSDVSPLRGVTLGAGGQSLTVEVDVVPV